MNYIIFDLEFNQQHPDDINTEEKKSSLIFEIIQIGAIKLDSKFNTISTFNALVKPTLYTKIHPYVENLTNIKDDDLINSDNFNHVYNDFIKFIGKEDHILVTWGNADITELLKNIKYHKLSNDPLSLKYIDIQQYTSKIFKLQKGTRIGLKKAVEALNIDIKGEFHDAFSDAFYTSEIFKAVHNKNIKPKTFSMPTNKRPKVIKEKLDNNALIKEFEKIYNRKMSKEEIAIIRLAYFMGKTKQFIVKSE